VKTVVHVQAEIAIAVMVIVVAVPLHVAMALVVAADSVADKIVVTHVHRVVTALQVKVAVVRVVVLVTVISAVAHAVLVIVTDRVSHSVNGWRSHVTSKSSSSRKTNPPKPLPITSAPAVTPSACSTLHALCSLAVIASMPASPALLSVPQVSLSAPLTVGFS
jgi:hypothetical protein